MTKEEVNMYLGKNLFGIECPCEYHQFAMPIVNDNAEIVFSNYEAACHYHGGTLECTKLKAMPNYMENWQQVFEKIDKYKIEITNYKFLHKDQTKDSFNCCIDLMDDNPRFIYGKGDTIGEAVCRCAVEYLKKLREME